MNRFLPVRLMEVIGVDKSAVIFLALPLAAHGFVVYNIQHMCMKIVGKKEIVGGFQRHSVPLLFLQQYIFRFFLTLRQVRHHVI